MCYPECGNRWPRWDSFFVKTLFYPLEIANVHRGYKWLSEFLPMEIQDIEKVIKGKGIEKVFLRITKHEHVSSEV